MSSESDEPTNPFWPPLPVRAVIPGWDPERGELYGVPWWRIADHGVDLETASNWMKKGWVP